MKIISTVNKCIKILFFGHLFLSFASYSQTSRPTTKSALLPSKMPELFAVFEGLPRTGRRYRWLAQPIAADDETLSRQECQIPLPYVSFEDTQAPRHFIPDVDDSLDFLPSVTTVQDDYFPREVLTKAKAQKQALYTDAPSHVLLEHSFPKLQGVVYGFNKEGQSTGEISLNTDLLSMRMWGYLACHSHIIPASGTEKTYALNMKRYMEAASTILFAGKKIVLPAKASIEMLKQTVVFTNDSNDRPYIAIPTSAAFDIVEKLNIRLKIKLANDLKKLRQQKQNDLINPASPFAQMPLFALPKHIDEIFTPCPVDQYFINENKTRSIYVLRCGTEAKIMQFGIYEQTHQGLSLVKTNNKELPTLGFFNLNAWMHPYYLAWIDLASALKNKKSYESLTLVDAKYTKGRTGNPYFSNTKYPESPIFYPNLMGVFDLTPYSDSALAQVYLAFNQTEVAEQVFVGLEAGFKSGDVWSLRKQNWPTRRH